MRFPVQKRWVVIVMLVLIPMITVTGAPQWASNTLEDMWDYPEASSIIKNAGLKNQDLSAECDFVRQRIQIKETILDELEIQKISLADAAKQFYIMDHDRPCVSNMLYPKEQIGAEAEISATSVIRHMRSRINCKNRPRIAETIIRIEREYITAFGYTPPE